MAITYYAGKTMTGTASDRTGGTWTNLQTGWRFLETDTGRQYYWNGTIWVTLSGANADVSKTGNYTLTAADTVIRADASGGAFTLTLPTAAGITGKTYTVKRTDILASTNLVTITTTSSQTIDSAANQYLWPGEFIQVESDGSNWAVTQRSNPSLTMYHMRKGSTANMRYCAGSQGPYVALLASTTSPAINTLWALPFLVPKTTKFDTLSFRIGTGAASSQARAGIYRDSGNMYPGSLVFDTGAVSTVSSGHKETTITAGLQVLGAGMYWLAWECDTTGLQIWCLASTGTHFAMLGFDIPASNNASAYGYSVAHTFGALPDPYTASATVLSAAPSVSNPVPAIFMRAI